MRTFVMAVGVLAVLGGTGWARGTGPGTRPASRPTTRGAVAVVSLAVSDRAYARRAEETGREYERAMRIARQQRERELAVLLDRALTGKRLDEANRVRALLDGVREELAAGGRRVVTLHVAGTVDGRCELVVRQDRAEWRQLELGLPADVTVNGVSWDVVKSATLENGGRTQFMAARADFRTAALVKKAEGREPVEVDAGPDSVRIGFDDRDPGAGRYDLTIEFQPAGAGPVVREGEGRGATTEGNSKEESEK